MSKNLGKKIKISEKLLQKIVSYIASQELDNVPEHLYCEVKELYDRSQDKYYSNNMNEVRKRIVDLEFRVKDLSYDSAKIDREEKIVAMEDEIKGAKMRIEDLKMAIKNMLISKINFPKC